MVLGGSTGHGDPHGLWWQHGSHQAAAHPLVFGSIADYEYQHGLWQNHRSLTSTQLLEATRATGINLALGGTTDHGVHMDPGCKHGFWGQHEPWRSFEEARSRKRSILHLWYPVVAQSQGDCG